MENQHTHVCPRSFLRTCRAILAAPANYGRDVVKIAYKWASRNPATAPRSVRESIGVVVGSAVDFLSAPRKRLEDRAEQLVQDDRVDRIVREWELGTADSRIPEVEWAYRLRDRFGVVSASEPARQTGERWVLKQLEGLEGGEFRCIPIEPFFGDAPAPVHSPGSNSVIAAIAATLWMTPTRLDRALRRHQGFRN
uniref:ORF2 n=1 Tax=Ethiopia maize-associated virus TaxID=2201471 RepID=A0A2U9IZP1_9VIRU|nr:ORF2 [Ethiopia maize-associated virus]